MKSMNKILLLGALLGSCNETSAQHFGLKLTAFGGIQALKIKNDGFDINHLLKAATLKPSAQKEGRDTKTTSSPLWIQTEPNQSYSDLIPSYTAGLLGDIQFIKLDRITFGFFGALLRTHVEAATKTSRSRENFRLNRDGSISENKAAAGQEEAGQAAAEVSGAKSIVETKFTKQFRKTDGKFQYLDWFFGPYIGFEATEWLNIKAGAALGHLGGTTNINPSFKDLKSQDIDASRVDWQIERYPNPRPASDDDRTASVDDRIAAITKPFDLYGSGMMWNGIVALEFKVYGDRAFVTVLGRFFTSSIKMEKYTGDETHPFHDQDLYLGTTIPLTKRIWGGSVSVGLTVRCV